MDNGSLPAWAQAASIIAIALTTAIVGVIKYFKTESKPETIAAAGNASVISASLIDSKLLKELIEAIRELQDEQGRDVKKTHRLSQDLKEAISELNEAIIVQTDATMNIVRFVTRQSNRNKLVDTDL